MKVQTCFLCFIVTVFQSVIVNGQLSNLTCKSCNRVTSLDYCTGSVKCAVGEICYMEELITDEITVVYNGGCRSKVVCSSGVSGSPSIGRRDLQKREDLVACSRCCDIPRKNGIDCNSRLCGIKYINTNSTRCFLCDNTASDAEQGNVDKPEDCLSETTCQPNEACGAERLDFSGVDSHRYTCLPKRICSLLTHEALERKDECMTNPDPRICGNTGSGKRAATYLCTACCGDGLCNSGSCEQIIDRLYNLWKGGILDFNTLKKKASTSVAPPQTPAPTTTVPTTPAPTTPAPTTPAPTTPAPTTPIPTTPAPTTPAPTTPAPTTPIPTTPAPTTPIPTTPAPTTPSTTPQAPTKPPATTTTTVPQPPTQVPTNSTTAAQPQTPAVAAVVATQAGSSVAPSTPQTRTPSTMSTINTTTIIG